MRMLLQTRINNKDGNGDSESGNDDGGGSGGSKEDKGGDTQTTVN
jgi:hypothetical protein